MLSTDYDDISEEAQLVLDRIENHVYDNTLYSGKNTDLVSLNSALRKAGYDPLIVKETWLYCGGCRYVDRHEYSDYWNMFWTKNIGKIRDYPDPSDYGISYYEINKEEGNIPACTCGHPIHYVNFICDPTFTILLLIGSDCALKFCGGCPCQRCGKLQSKVRTYCSQCRCKYKGSSNPNGNRLVRCCNAINSVSQYCNFHYIESELNSTIDRRLFILENRHTYSMTDVSCLDCNRMLRLPCRSGFRRNYQCSICVITKLIYKRCINELFNEYEERRDDLDKYHSVMATVPSLCRECYKPINYKYKYCFHCNKKRKFSN